ncbi:hypothetical protein LSH36_284g01002 [Paralvinella palmiformis]|uniref:Uncharacterized protein n=1 Tax=Paralvinella palmiformis TaxID=53620 RepID=A0AAD9JJX9_9ANNE|nr:hypothetical protein LSH36_284g01002 [Paralvinella palmiformis]
MISVLRSVLYLWTTFSLCGHTMAAPSRDCDCTDPRDFARCGCDESAAAEKSRTKRDLSTSWNDGPISPDEQGVAELKRSPEVGNSLGDAHALNAVFRWGKRNAADDVSSAYSNVFRWGKRSPIFGYDVPEVGGDDSSQDSVDSGDIKRIFRWGKRSRGPSASRCSGGERDPARMGTRRYSDGESATTGMIYAPTWEH